jgi:uncharacterized protein
MDSSHALDLRGRKFEFDERKRQENITKHGLDFNTAKRVFEDESVFVFESPQEHDEKRYVAIGKISERILAVIFTFRGHNIRIISARMARIKERELWHKKLLM